MRPREIFMHRKVIGWVIYGGRHYLRAKIFHLSQSGIKPRSLDLQANTLRSLCQLVMQDSRSVLYIPRPCDMFFWFAISALSNSIPEYIVEPGHEFVLLQWKLSSILKVKYARAIPHILNYAILIKVHGISHFNK